MDNQNIRVKERVQESLIKNPTDYTIEEVIKLYPKYLTFTGSKNFFVTPLLLNKYDLMLLYLEKDQFNNVFEKLKGINNFVDKNLTSDNLFKEYSSFILNSDNNDNNTSLFILNLCLLLQANCYETFFQKTLVYYKNKNKKQKGGINLRERLLATGGIELIENSFNISSILITLTAINSLLGNPLSFSNIIILSIIILSLGTRRNVSLTGRVLNRGIGMLPPNIRNNRAVRLFSNANVDTVQNYFNNFNCRISKNISEQLRRQYASYTSKLYNNEMNINSIPYEELKTKFIKFQEENKYLTDNFTKEQIIDEPVQPPNIPDDQLRNFIQFNQNDEGRTIANLTQEGIIFFTNLSQSERNFFKTKLQNLFQNQQEKAALIRLNLTTLLPPSPQQKVIQRREFKKVRCPICDKNFSFNPTNGYIHQESPNEDDIDEHINKLREANPDIVINDELREQIERKLQFYYTLNIFPCKQVIQSLTAEQKKEPAYIFNSENGENAENGEVYGSKLMCSNCCLDSLSNLDYNVYKLYFGAQSDNTYISDDLVLELVANLTPTELFEIFNFQFNKNIMSHFKFYQNKTTTLIVNKKITQLNLPNDNEHYEQSRNTVINDYLRIVSCPTCNFSTVGRFYRVYEKNDIEIMYLRCSACATLFNGCDGHNPYLLSIKDFKNLANSRQTQNFDLCGFFNNNLNPRVRREHGLCRVNIEAYKRIKTDVIRANVNRRVELIGNYDVKKCPQCQSFNRSVGGCTVMRCDNCRASYCYICLQRTAGHDSSHYPTSVDMSAPFATWHTIQCINVNFTGVDPDGKRGPHYNVFQPGEKRSEWFPSARDNDPKFGWNLRPNPAYERQSRIIW